LNFIDLFSQYVWSVPLKDKTATSITTALKYLFQNSKPISIHSNKGTEFLNATVPKTSGIKFSYNSNPVIKGAIERFSRSLKSKMNKYLKK
jgi:transposase InsO family protein